MDTVATFDMTEKLSNHKILTAVHKHYSIDEWAQFISQLDADLVNYIMLSTSTSEADFERIKTIFSPTPSINFLCIDVANSYTGQTHWRCG